MVTVPLVSGVEVEGVRVVTVPLVSGVEVEVVRVVTGGLLYSALQRGPRQQQNSTSRFPTGKKKNHCKIFL